MPHEQPLAGQHVALLFEKPSLRTRSTFQIAVRELGGDVIEPPREDVFGGRETIADVARNLERWVYGAVVRTYAQARLEAFAAAAPRLRVVNALTDEEHPCQALADCLTLSRSWGPAGANDRLRRRRQQRRHVAGAGGAAAGRQRSRRVARAASSSAPRLRERIESRARFGARLTLTDRSGGRRPRRRRGLHGRVDVDGPGGEAAGRHAGLRAVPGQRRADGARRTRRALHALPARPSRRRGHDEVIDSDASVVFDQAENRLHTQKALLAMLA